jgi:hypothetical protein
VNTKEQIDLISWSQAREYFSSLDASRRHIFRGQADSRWPLATSADRSFEGADRDQKAAVALLRFVTILESRTSAYPRVSLIGRIVPTLLVFSLSVLKRTKRFLKSVSTFLTPLSCQRRAFLPKSAFWNRWHLRICDKMRNLVFSQGSRAA